MFYYIILVFFLYLPLQFALSPAPDIDLATARIIVPSLAILWMLIGLKNKKLLFPKTKTTLFFTSFLFLSLFSLFFAQNVAWSIRKLAFLYSLAPLYFILPAFFTDKAKFKQGINFLIYGAVLLATIGIIQFFCQFLFGLENISTFWSRYVAPFFLGNSLSQAVTQNSSWLVHIGNRDYLRAVSVFPDPHMLAFYLGMVLPWPIALFLVNEKKKYTYLFCALIILLADLLTFSRGGYLGLFLGLLFALFLLRKKLNKKIFLVPALLLAIIFLYPGNPVTKRLVSSFDLQDGSNKGRIEIWQQAVEIIVNNPQGVGLGNYPLAIKPTADYREPIYAHSLYLDIASEIGLLGLLFWLLFILSSFFQYMKSARQDPLFFAGAFSIIIYSGHALVENPLFSVHIFSLLLIITSLGTLKYYANH